MQIIEVGLEYLNTVIENRVPIGLFLTLNKNENGWIACDNSTGDAWTEDFKSEDAARRWLKGKFEKMV